MAMRPRPMPGGGLSRRWEARDRRPSSPVFSSSPRTRVGPFDPSRAASSFDAVLADFTARWERGETPRAEDELDRRRPDRPDEAVELIYREFCMADRAGLDPRPHDYLARFPDQAEALGRLFGVHDALGSSRLRLWAGPDGSLPEVGDEIGPYRLIRALGEGGFARVFLAEQADLDDRLVVVKVSTRVTAEPRLLARSSHPHIAEVLWHGEVADGSLQVICMPFVGGATLSKVLAARVGRGRRARPGSGRDLLDDLDRVSAPGFLPRAAGRPARELIAGLSYRGASAWVVARLAEALDHAYGRGVLHGDVKPANVLLAADGTPMLLDFNLAVGWRPRAGGRADGDLPGDAGGTLAYMAPERLRAVAEPGRSVPPSAAERHRADVYALGVVLLEMLTGRSPDLAGVRPQSLQELASAYVSSRRGGGGGMIRSARTTLPAGLRAVLARCLAADPADRYSRASELAEDLDLWRLDRALRFASEPSRGLGLLRWARRRRLALAAGLVGLAVAVAATACVWWVSAQVVTGRSAAGRDSQIEDWGAFLNRRAGAGVLTAGGNPAEIARRHLDRYGVLGPGDWRRRDAFRALPTSEQADLEVWLLEQALRYVRALSDRPDTPDDWRRALSCAERVADSTPFGPLHDLRLSLRRRLEIPEPPAVDLPPPSAAPPRRSADYLQGVAAELDHRDAAAATHYAAVLSEWPGSFWANYRAAAVACARGAKATEQGASAAAHGNPAAAGAAETAAFGYYAYAAGRMAECVRLRAENADLRLLFAGCLHGCHRYQEAAEECDAAQRLEPDQAETYLSRSMFRLQLGQVDGFLKDIARFDVLTGRRGTGMLALSPLDPTQRPGAPRDKGDDDSPTARPSGNDPVAANLGYLLALKLGSLGHHDLARGEIDRVLELDPDDVRALFLRGMHRRRFESRESADRDFARVVAHPRVEAYLRGFPKGLLAFDMTVSSLIRQGKAEDAIETATRGVKLADRFWCMQAELRYNLARAYALAAATDPGLRTRAARQLAEASRFGPGYVDARFLWEPLFDPIRSEVDAENVAPRTSPVRR